MTTLPDLSSWLSRAEADARLAWFSRGLNIRLVVSMGGGRWGLRLCETPRTLGDGEQSDPDIAIDGPPDAWAEVFRLEPRPGYHSFGAWLRHDVGIKVRADPLMQAQALAALERLVELARPSTENESASQNQRNYEDVIGRRRRLAAPDGDCLIHWLEAGEGAPLLFLHTAGADARQYLHQVADVELQRRHKMLAFDMPLHGQSGGVTGSDVHGIRPLTAKNYSDWCVTFIEEVVGAPAFVVGCSMGAAMALTLTADRPDLVRGCIALEAPLRAPGRRSDLLADARVANGWHNPAYVRALLSPSAPQRFRDEACAIYEQARPGVYMADLAYYSDEYDGAALAGKLNSCGRPIALLTGSYDYSASPRNTRELQAAIGNPNVRFAEMAGLGHFPMIEDPDRFRPHLLEALGYLNDRAAT